MNKRKILLAINLAVTTAAIATLAYLWTDGLIIQTDVRRATEQCTEEVQNGCPLLYNYASLLEHENARLNLRVKECNVLIPETVPSTDSGR